MKDIAIYGAGGFGREIACLIKHINQHADASQQHWRLIGFFDDGKAKGTRNEYGEVLGGMDELNQWDTPIDVVIAIGSPQSVKNIAERVTNPNVSWPNIIAPDTFFLDPDNIEMGHGNIVCPRCFFSCHVRMGNFNFFNGYVTVGHDDVIGNYNCMMPAVRLSGELTIGDNNFFGVASVVLQQHKIGHNVTIGANSVVIRNPKDGCTYVGNPAKKIEY
jgi:sugar O-acyltransferase (sialic acid O-acetyltransferase NeuD family)